MIRPHWRLHVPVLVCFLVMLGARAQQAATSAPVARLSHLAGSVQVQAQDGTDAATDAALNMPLPQGERISTGESGEAEVEFADGSVLRLTPNSTAVLERLESTSEIQLLDGLFYLELRYSDRGSYAILAGDQTIAPQENASFRIRVSAGQVETGVFTGAVAVSRQSSYSADLQAGESLRSDPKNPKRYFLSATLQQESWDNWNEKLSQAAQDEASLRTSARDAYAGDQGYGWADLDANGTWYNVPGEGSVWQPTAVDASFDPYGYGSWTYGPGGYTWASGYNWGWLPYRCGIWSYYPGFGWGWLPASGCRSYGGGYGGGSYGGNGWGGGGFPVRNPPQGWHPPRRPDNIADGKRHHPTLPVHPLTDAFTTGLAPRKNSEQGAPIRIGSSLATVIKPVGRGYTPHGGSAVGSTLLRDFPVHAGTHDPVLGLQTQGPVAVPGRPAEWHHIDTNAAQTAGRQRVPDTTAAPVGGGVYSGGVVTGNPTRRGPIGEGTPQRYPRQTDPPFNANGAPPVNATGAPPRNATGIPTVPANAAPPSTFGNRQTNTVPAPTPVIPMRTPSLPRQVDMQPTYRMPQSAPVMPRNVAPSPPMPRPAPTPSAPQAPRVGPSIK